MLPFPQPIDLDAPLVSATDSDKPQAPAYGVHWAVDALVLGSQLLLTSFFLTQSFRVSINSLPLANNDTDAFFTEKQVLS